MITLHGARPVFADIHYDTLNINDSFSEFPIKLIMYGGVLLATLGVCFGAFLVIASPCTRTQLTGHRPR